MQELYIYYRSRVTHAGQVQKAVLDWQRALAGRHPALCCRLLRKPVSHDDTLTWMETYASHDAAQSIGIDTLLGVELAGGAPMLSEWVEGQRNVEVFVACAS